VIIVDVVEDCDFSVKETEVFYVGLGKHCVRTRYFCSVCGAEKDE